MAIVFNYACDVFVQFVFPCGGNYSIPVFYGKDKMNVDLGVCI